MLNKYLLILIVTTLLFAVSVITMLRGIVIETITIYRVIGLTSVMSQIFVYTCFIFMPLLLIISKNKKVNYPKSYTTCNYYGQNTSEYKKNMLMAIHGQITCLADKIISTSQANKKQTKSYKVNDKLGIIHRSLKRIIKHQPNANKTKRTLFCFSYRS